MVSTCSRPFNDVLKIFTAPEWTTNKPGQGFPSVKMISPLFHLLGMALSARDCTASSLRSEKKETLFRVAMRSAFPSFRSMNALYKTRRASAPERYFRKAVLGDSGIGSFVRVLDSGRTYGVVSNLIPAGGGVPRFTTPHPLAPSPAHGAKENKI